MRRNVLRASARSAAPKDTGTLDLALRILDHLAKQASPIALLGETSRSNFEIVTVARDGVLKLRDTTGQAVSLCALLDDDLVVLDLMHGRSVVEFTTRPGTRLALHTSAHGKIWLAVGPEALIKKVLSGPRPPWTSHTLIDAKAIAVEVQMFRKRAWSTAPNQAVMGVNTLAAPVFDHRGILVGSIAIVGSTQVIAPKPVPAQLGAVLKAAREVSRDLGWKGQQ